jgi:hypothetical protein
VSTNRFLRIFSSSWARAIALAFVFFLGLQGKTCFASDWSAIQTAIGVSGNVMPGDVLRIELVRTDLIATVDGQSLPKNETASVFNGFVAFKPSFNGNFFVDGALPAQETEVDALVAALRANTQIAVTGISNRLINETPKIVWVYFEAGGDGGDLATTLASALAVIKNPQMNVVVTPGTSGVIDPSSILPPKFLKLFDEGYVELLDATFAFYLPRPDERSIFLGDARAETGLGVGQSFNITLNFASGTDIVLNIDFALKREEVQDAEDALRAGGFTITAEGSRYLNDDPRLVFVHVTGSGDGFALGNTLYDVIQIIQRDSRHGGNRGW